jgi:flagellar motility protein MotE (MotC chaperone)
MVDNIAKELIGLQSLAGIITDEQATKQTREIDRMRNAEKTDAAAKRQAALDKELAESLGQYDAEKERLKKEIATLTAQARAGFGKRKNPLADHDYLPKGPLGNKLQTLSSSASAGTFSGFAAKMLGRAAPGVNERIAAASEETNELLEKLIGKVGEAGVGL